MDSLTDPSRAGRRRAGSAPRPLLVRLRFMRQSRPVPAAESGASTALWADSVLQRYGALRRLRTTRPTPSRPMHKTARQQASRAQQVARARNLLALQLRLAQSGIGCTEERRARQHHLHLYKMISAVAAPPPPSLPRAGRGGGGGRPAGGNLGWREEEAGPAQGTLGDSEAPRRPAFQAHRRAAAKSAGVEAPVGPSHPPAVSLCRLRPGPAY